LDTKLLPKVTVYLTEVGVTDRMNFVTGSDNILVLEHFLTRYPNGLG
jgi:calcineurin-like phosphoesterase